MKKKFTVTKPEDVLTISGVILNSDTRMIASTLNYNAQILKDALNRIAELEDYIKEQQDTGYWIEHIEDPRNCIEYLECSKCASWFLREHLTRNTYCPNCGSRNEKVRY